MNNARRISRIVAYFIDLIIATIFSIIAIIIIVYASHYLNWLLNVFLLLLFDWIIYAFINTITLYFFHGRTVGGYLLHIKIMKTNLAPLTFKNALVKSVTLGFLPMVIVNAIYMLVVKTERTIFDRLTDTIALSWHRH